MTAIEVSEAAMTPLSSESPTSELRFGWVSPQQEILSGTVAFLPRGEAQYYYPSPEALPFLITTDPGAVFGYNVRFHGRNELHIGRKPLSLEEVITLPEMECPVARVPVFPQPLVTYEQVRSAYLDQEVQRLRQVVTHYKTGFKVARHETRRLARRASDAESSAAHAVDQVRKSRIDPITGISNARAFEEQIPRILEEYLGSNRSLSVWYIDFDGLKKANEYGHHHGDAVLKAGASVLAEYFKRSGESLFRRGERKADEFVGTSPELDRVSIDRRRKHIYDEVATLKLPNPHLQLRYPDGRLVFGPEHSDLRVRLSIGVAILSPSYFLHHPEHPEYAQLSPQDMFTHVASTAEARCLREKVCHGRHPNASADEQQEAYTQFMALHAAPAMSDSSPFKL